LVGRSSRNSGKISSPSKVRAMTTLPPAANVIMDRWWPPTCDADPPGIMMSSELIRQLLAALAMIQPSVPKLWQTPFGFPVLPDVKKMIAGSSGFGGARSRVGSPSVNDPKLGPSRPPSSS
jgi:hypothetical protein